jgi:hypothetical protein
MRQAEFDFFPPSINNNSDVFALGITTLPISLLGCARLISQAREPIYSIDPGRLSVLMHFSERAARRCMSVARFFLAIYLPPA